MSSPSSPDDGRRIAARASRCSARPARSAARRSRSWPPTRSCSGSSPWPRGSNAAAAAERAGDRLRPDASRLVGAPPDATLRRARDARRRRPRRRRDRRRSSACGRSSPRSRPARSSPRPTRRRSSPVATWSCRRRAGWRPRSARSAPATRSRARSPGCGRSIPSTPRSGSAWSANRWRRSTRLILTASGGPFLDAPPDSSRS